MIPRSREVQECRFCKNKCIGKFVDDEDKDCGNFIAKRVSAEEKFLRSFLIKPFSLIVLCELN